MQQMCHCEAYMDQALAMVRAPPRIIVDQKREIIALLWCNARLWTRIEVVQHI
jgi:hypothetical protein